MIAFADSIEPGNIPGAFTHVAAYSNGRYAWPDGQLARFERHIEIAVFAGSPSQAARARVLDIERFDAAASDFPPFAVERHSHGHDDPTAYCSIDTLPDLIAEISRPGYRGMGWRLWLAWWWERMFPPTAAEVLAEIRALTGIVLPPRQLWACQWLNGPSYDSSVLYGRDDFTIRPTGTGAASTETDGTQAAGTGAASTDATFPASTRPPAGVTDDSGLCNATPADRPWPVCAREKHDGDTLHQSADFEWYDGEPTIYPRVDDR